MINVAHFVQFCEAKKAKMAKLQKADLHYKARLLHKSLTALKCRPQWLKQVNFAVTAKLDELSLNTLRLFGLINLTYYLSYSFYSHCISVFWIGHHY